MAAQLVDQDAAAEVAEKQATPSLAPEHPRRRPILAVAITVSAVALATSVLLAWQYQHHRDIDDASRAALASAQDYAVALMSIDTGSVDDNFAKVVGGATGEFKDMYSQSAAQLRQVLIDNEAMSKGIVVDAAVKAATKDKVEVLLFVDQSITNVANPAARLDRSRVAMTMERVDGRWLASHVELK